MTPHTPVEGLVAKWREKAKALGDAQGPNFYATFAACYRARADELEQALASLPVEGWVWVPRNPTREMMAAGAEIVGHILPEDDGETDPHYVSIGAAIGVYGAMLAAAPQDQRQGNEQGGEG